MTLSKLCERGCGLQIYYLGPIEGKSGSTGWWEHQNELFKEQDMGEHTFNRCNKLIRNHLKKDKPVDPFQEKLF
jgi:hypothetical protein